MEHIFSYEYDDEYLFDTDGPATGHITPVGGDGVIARISFTMPDGAEIPPPADITLINMSQDERVPVSANGFFIAWTSNYELRSGEKYILALRTQRHQKILRGHAALENAI